MSQLNEGSTQVASASLQVSSASAALAEGASEQAAGLEEASSSLEEMNSMVQQNAESIQQAGDLSNSASTAAYDGVETMSQMHTAMKSIQQSSDQIEKVIKVIDDIAFQTNLLALNAAVEAARAGEAGKGFAVVAEEVRNLASRSAEAARSTTDLISQSMKNSQEGVAIVDDMAAALKEIAGRIGKASEFVNKISVATQEHSAGISQISSAVSQIDHVTQANAANAEESASAAAGIKPSIGEHAGNCRRTTAF